MSNDKNITDGHKKLHEILLRVGLDDSEIRTYIMLLTLGPSSASVIAKNMHTPRSSMYVILKRLQERGLVTETKENSKTRFHSESPDVILHYLKRKESEISTLTKDTEALLPFIESFEQTFSSQPEVSLIKGFEGMKYVYKEILEGNFVGIMNAKAMYDTFGTTLGKHLIGKSKKLTGRDLLVDNEGVKKFKNEVDQSPTYKYRVLPKNCKAPTDTIIVNDVVIHFAFDKEQTIIRLRNQNIADAHRQWFDCMWEISKEA